MTCCNIEIFLHVSMCSYCQRCSHCSLSGGPNILCVCNGGVQNAYTPPCSLHCWRTCLDGSCSSGRSNIAFPNQVPHQCAHTTPPILWSFTGYKAREIDCTHILSQVYLLLFLYGSHIGKKHIYITWRVILFFSRCLSREGGEQGHACVCARMLAAGDALVLLSQVKYLHLCMSLPSSQWKGALILSWAGERQCENKKLHRQEFFSTTATGSNILNIVCLSN